MASALRDEGHRAWTAFEANLPDASDETLIIYADDKGAIFVTNNADAAQLARRMQAARTVYLRVVESNAVKAMARAEEWLRSNRLPKGRVLRVPLNASIKVTAPLPRS